MSESMIERVALAICTSQTQSDLVWEAFLPEAREAIEAMREPTEEMWAKSDIVSPEDATDIWQSMIDAALKERA